MVAQEPLELYVQVRILAPQCSCEPGFEGRPDSDGGAATKRSGDVLGRAGWPTEASVSERRRRILAPQCSCELGFEKREGCDTT